MKGKFDLESKFEGLTADDCFISEITLAELKFGVENSERPNKYRKALGNFLTGVQISRIFGAFDLYAKEKERFRKAGTRIDDFDLLISVTSIINNLVMVTNNTGHFERTTGLNFEDWTMKKEVN
jgi:tRNA(fMet)-specific endonuclease VapC